MSPHWQQVHRRDPHRSWVVLLVGVLLLRPAVGFPADMDVGNIAVLEADATIVPEAFDLDGTTLEFTPQVGGGYAVQMVPFTFETNTGASLGLGDDDFAQRGLGFTFPFFNERHTTVVIDANGFVSFTGPTIGPFSESLMDFAINRPRIAALWDDLNPSAGGSVHFNQLGDRVVVTWQNVPEFPNFDDSFTTGGINTFQLVLFSNGTIRTSYNGVALRDGLVGVSPGAVSELIGASVDFSAGPTASVLTGLPDSLLLAQLFADPTDATVVPTIPIQAVARKFYQTHEDAFDQLVIITNFEHSLGDVFAFEFNITQSVDGLGLPLFAFPEAYGSAGQLQSVLNMNRLDLYPDDPEEDFLGTNNTLDLLGQEAGHQWLAFVRFDDNGVESSALLGREDSHWSFFLDTDASDMEGNNWADNGNGTFTTNEATARYNSLDQYLMGLRTPAEVPDFFLITNPVPANPCPELPRPPFGFGACPPEIGVTVSGKRRSLSIDQIIAAEGGRVPAAGFSMANPTNVHRQAFILLVRPGTSPSPQELRKWETIRAAWIPYFAEATGGRGRIETALGTNMPPVADAGMDQMVHEGTLVTLDGSRSTDADGTIAAFSWTQTAGTPVALSNPLSAQPTFTAPAVEATGAVLTFQLTVTDNAGASAITGVNIQVVPCPPDGDVNQDNHLTPSDALIAFQHFLGIAMPLLDVCQQHRANIVEPWTSGITPADSLCIFGMFLGLPSCLD